MNYQTWNLYCEVFHGVDSETMSIAAQLLDQEMERYNFTLPKEPVPLISETPIPNFWAVLANIAYIEKYPEIRIASDNGIYDINTERFIGWPDFHFTNKKSL